LHDFVVPSFSAGGWPEDQIARRLENAVRRQDGTTFDLVCKLEVFFDLCEWISTRGGVMMDFDVFEVFAVVFDLEQRIST
jgi:hypothetical protein